MEARYIENKLQVEDEKAFYRRILNSVNASVHILRIDKNGKTLPVWINPQYEQIMGYDMDYREKIGYTYKADELYHPDDIEIIRQAIIKVLKNREEGVASMFRVKDGKGRWKWVLISGIAYDISGDPDHLLCVMVDVSESMANYFALTEEYTKEIRRLNNKLLLNELTKTEKEIIALLFQGKTTKEIAQIRHRSYETINNHKRNIFRKLDIHKVSELASFATECGLV